MGILCFNCVMEFREYVHQLEILYRSAGGVADFTPPALREVMDRVPARILLISPHPDDECLMSGLALRARKEEGAQVAVLPFSFGSLKGRHLERKAELEQALRVLDFEYRGPEGPGPEWGVDQILAVLEAFEPDAVVMPHAEDGHPTHIRAHEAGRLACQRWVDARDAPLSLYFTEYWQSLRTPNLLVPLSAEIVAQMGEALLMHRGELERNPYHLSLPANLMDQFRRGSERVGGLGSKPRTDSIFGQLFQHLELKPS